MLSLVARRGEQFLPRPAPSRAQVGFSVLCNFALCRRRLRRSATIHVTINPILGSFFDGHGARRGALSLRRHGRVGARTQRSPRIQDGSQCERGSTQVECKMQLYQRAREGR